MTLDEKTDRQLLLEIHDAVTTLQIEVKHDREDLKEVRCEVYGNGKDGLKAELAEHLARHDERGKFWKLLTASGNGVGLAGLLAAIFK